MNLKLTTELSREEFDRFVMAHEDGSFLQSSAWGAWMAANGKIPLRAAVLNEANQIILAAQIFITAVPKVRGNYLYIPYGPLLAKTIQPDVANFFFTQIAGRFPSSLFLRLEPKRNFPAIGKPTPHVQPGKTLVLDLRKTEAELLADMHQKTRYNIKVAQRHEVNIEVSNGETGISAALSLINETSSRQGYKNHPLSYYQSLIQFFTEGSEGVNLQVYSARCQNQILASAIMLDFAGTRSYLFGGTSKSERNVMAPYLLHWQAIQDAKQAGLDTYDFWGIETASGKTPGFVRFKLGWGGTQVSYPPATDIVYKPIWYRGYKLLRSLNKKLH